MNRVAFEFVIRFLLGHNPDWNEWRSLVYDNRSPSEVRRRAWRHES